MADTAVRLKLEENHVRNETEVGSRCDPPRRGGSGRDDGEFQRVTVMGLADEVFGPQRARAGSRAVIEPTSGSVGLAVMVAGRPDLSFLIGPGAS